jgi:hypothetical protein
MSTEPETVEDEATRIFKHLVAERVDARRPALAIHELAILRKVSLLLASDDVANAHHIAALLDKAPGVTNPGARPAETLAEVCAPDRPLAVELLSNEMLLQAENIEATMSGRAVPIKNPRVESALALVWLVDEAVRSGEKLNEERARELVAAVLAPVVTPGVLWPGHQEELSVERGRRLALEEQLRSAEHQLQLRQTGKVTDLNPDQRRAQAEAQAPIVRSGSSVDRLSSTVSNSPFVGDHLGYT